MRGGGISGSFIFPRMLKIVELYSGIFTADKVKLWMNELDLEPYFIDVVKEHKIFF